MSPESNDGANLLGYRCVLSGRLTTKSFLHIGAAKPVVVRSSAPHAKDQEPKVIPVVPDSDGRAIIPATALRGAIRSRLTQLDPSLANRLMGIASEAEEEDEPSISSAAENGARGQARRVFVQTATVVKPCAEGLFFDDPQKCVDRIPMTAISRWRRAPQDAMLRTVEAVPPGVMFSVSFGIVGEPGTQIADSDVAALLWALRHFETDKCFQLGAFQGSGWGRVEWTPCGVSKLTPESLLRWLSETPHNINGRQGWALCAVPVDLGWFRMPETKIEAKGITLQLTLDFQSSFLTEDHRTYIRDQNLAPNGNSADSPKKVAKVMRVNGRAWLNGQSLKGALRSQFERILRTKGIYCCDPTQDEKAGGQPAPPEKLERERRKLHTGPRCPPIRSVEELGDLCFACQIFGNGGWASAIDVSEFSEEEGNTTVDERREFIAISRFTGGGAPQLKFSADVAVQPKLKGTIRINVDRLCHVAPSKNRITAEAKLGALLHLFRDFNEGDIPLAAGRSKGFGAFKVTDVTRDSGERANDLGSALESILGKDTMDGVTLSVPASTWLDCLDKYPKAEPPATSPADSQDSWGFFSSQTLDTIPAKPGDHANSTQLGSYNPYHWVPAIQAPDELRVSAGSFGAKAVERHDVYARDGISGELTVRITPITPMFVGGEQQKGEPTTVMPFEIGGKPAIPSTTLRGLLSSTYEIATASAMRVLESDEIYSYRIGAEPGNAFDLIGRVTADGSGVIPWARRPEGERRDGTPIAAKIVPPAERRQPPVWEKVRLEDIKSTDSIANSYYHLDAPDRDMPDRRARKREIHFPAEPACREAIPFGPGVLDHFHRIADKRTSASRSDDPQQSELQLQPYGPLGQARGGDNGTYRVKPGDFLYFRTNAVGTQVTAIALSQLWRDDVTHSLGDLFREKDIPPLHPKRTDLTLAETAFGFVLHEDREKDSQRENANGIPHAYASKIIVSDATLEGDHGKKDTEETLKVLSSPKPPSPAFYFDPVGGRIPTYQDIRDLRGNKTGPRPRGRKMYLHLDWKQENRPWKSAQPPVGSDRDPDKMLNMQVRVQCLTVDNRFSFTIRFDNLKDDEFLALCYTLRPTPNYRHKLGMGKPLGLGSIYFDVTDIRRTDREDRYTKDGFGHARYAEVATEDPAGQQNPANHWVDCRAHEWSEKVADISKDLSNSLSVLHAIGTTRAERLQYPMTKEQSDGEWELFEWPSNNRALTSRRAGDLAGASLAHFLLPIDPSESSHAIPRMPSPCCVIVVAADEHGLARQIEGLRATRVRDQAAANIEIARQTHDTVIYILHQGRLRVNYNERRVTLITLSSVTNLTDEDERKIGLLQGALALGAK